MRGKKDKKGQQPIELPVDLARRVGGAGQDPPRTEEAAPEDAGPVVLPAPPRRSDAAVRPTFIGLGEPGPARRPPERSEERPEPSPGTTPFVSHRAPPGPGEHDLVVTPLATPDDWHRFELALRKVPGVGRIQPEYYRHGVLKLRLSYNGTTRLGQALREMSGYRVRVIGEDRRTLQILVAPDTDERSPG